MQHTETLNQNKDFLTLYRRGTCIPMRHIVVYARKNRFADRRLGITAGKKVGNAVHRNRAKRLIRVADRTLEDKLPRGLDIVIVARASISEAKAQDIIAQLGGRGLRGLNDVAAGKPPQKPHPANG